MQMACVCIIAVYVCIIYMYMVRRTATGVQRMCLVRPPGCGLCGAYVVVVGVTAHELVAACSACAGALCYKAAHSSMHICMAEVPLWGIQGAWCTWSAR